MSKIAILERYTVQDWQQSIFKLRIHSELNNTITNKINTQELAFIRLSASGKILTRIHYTHTYKYFKIHLFPIDIFWLENTWSYTQYKYVINAFLTINQTLIQFIYSTSRLGFGLGIFHKNVFRSENVVPCIKTNRHISRDLNHFTP